MSQNSQYSITSSSFRRWVLEYVTVPLEDLPKWRDVTYERSKSCWCENENLWKPGQKRPGNLTASLRGREQTHTGLRKCWVSTDLAAGEHSHTELVTCSRWWEVVGGRSWPEILEASQNGDDEWLPATELSCRDLCHKSTKSCCGSSVKKLEPMEQS